MSFRVMSLNRHSYTFYNGRSVSSSKNYHFGILYQEIYYQGRPETH